MLSVSALATDVRQQLCDMRDTGDVTQLQALAVKMMVLENIIQYLIRKKGCDCCPSYGRGVNNGNI